MVEDTSSSCLLNWKLGGVRSTKRTGAAIVNCVSVFLMCRQCKHQHKKCFGFILLHTNEVGSYYNIVMGNTI